MKYETIFFFLLISLNSFAQDGDFINDAINELKLGKAYINYDLIVSKVRPNNSNETIVVIPRIAEEDEGHSELEIYIAIVNNKTGKIINKYIEPSYWTSDAIVLSKISIDTAPYITSDNDRAFGIKAHYYGSARANPYENTTISLFIKSNNKLKKILNSCDVLDSHGEWDTDCAGEFTELKNIFIMSANKTNGCYDILVKEETTYTHSYVDRNGDCNSEMKIALGKSVLKFNGEEYTKDGTIPSLDVYLDDPDKTATNIRQEPNGKIITKLDEQSDYFTLRITEEKNGWFKVVKAIGVEGNNIAIPGGSGWIHNTVIGISTRRKVELLDAPEDGIIVGTIDQETGVQIKDKYKDWVKIEHNGLSGWIQAEWLCGNPVTTCP